MFIVFTEATYLMTDEPPYCTPYSVHCILYSISHYSESFCSDHREIPHAVRQTLRVIMGTVIFGICKYIICSS